MINTRTPKLYLDKNEDHLEYFTVLFISFLQGAFKGREPGNLRWCEDTDKTEILICDQSNMVTDRYLPKIVTVRGPTVPMPMFFGDVVDENPFSRAVRRSLLMESSITFHCIAKFGIETQYLAQQVQQYLHAHYLVLHRRGLHKLDRVLNISPETPAGQVFNPETTISEAVLIAVTCRFWYRHTIIATPSDNPAAREIENYIGTSMNGRQVVDKTTIRPKEIGRESENPTTLTDHQYPPTTKI